MSGFMALDGGPDPRKSPAERRNLRVRRRTSPGSAAVLKDRSADRCLLLQVAAIFFLQAARAGHHLLGLPGAVVRCGQALPDQLEPATKEPDERDGADPSDRDAAVARPADRGTGCAGRGP